MNRTVIRVLLHLLTALATGTIPPLALAGSSEIGFLVAQSPGEKLTPEADTACELARRLVGARVLWPAGGGTFVDRGGRPVALDRFAAIWCHQGDAATATGLTAEGQTLSAMRQFVAEGHGLLLSGAAAQLIASLEPGAVQVKPLDFGHDRGQAGLAPVQLKHPAFRNLDLERDVLWMSNAVYPAFAQFHPAGSPSRGILPWRPADTRFNDHSRVSAPAGTYEANPWGLHDMHGNVAEWTLSAYRPYPCREDDGRNQPTAEGRRTVRGGSWYDRPDRCRSAFRQGYVPEQGVYDVGFRVICEHEAPAEGSPETERDARRPAGSR